MCRRRRRARARAAATIGACDPDEEIHATPALDRIKQIEKNLKATVITQHDPRDIDKLPAFPAAAK